MTSLRDASTVKRHSLLRRNPTHERAFFSEYYENNHGPLAASQAGFRKFTTQYVQNHMLQMLDGSDPMFDGITMTTQVPRDDYSVGFFREPDYENVKGDEIFLFDVPKTVSVLGAENVVLDGVRTAHKAIVLSTNPLPGMRGVSRLVRNDLDTSTASALGFEASKFAYDTLTELWFASPADLEFAARAVGALEAGPSVFMPARELLIFGPGKPWSEA